MKIIGFSIIGEMLEVLIPVIVRPCFPLPKTSVVRHTVSF